jgi:hypothetical protein
MRRAPSCAKHALMTRHCCDKGTILKGTHPVGGVGPQGLQEGHFIRRVQSPVLAMDIPYALWGHGTER